MASSLRGRAIDRGDIHGNGEKAKPRSLDKNFAFEGEARLLRRVCGEVPNQRRRINPEPRLAVINRMSCRPRYPKVGHPVCDDSRAGGVMPACPAGTDDDVTRPVAATFQQTRQV